MRQPAGDRGSSRAPPERGTEPPSEPPIGAAGRAQRRVAWAAGAAAVALAAAALAAGPVARSFIEARARARGLDVEIQDASVVWGAVRLNGVTIRATELRGVSVVLGRVDVFPSALFVPRRIEVLGGLVRVDGPYDQVEADVARFRSAHRAGPGDGTARDGSAPAIVVDGVDVAWSRFAGASDSLHVWGLRFDRTGTGRDAASADLVRFAGGGVRADVVGGRVELARDGDHRVLVSSATDQVSAVIDLDVLTRHGADGDPSAAPGGRAPGDEPTVDPDRVDALRGPRLRKNVARIASKLAAVLSPLGKIQLTNVRFEVRRAGETLNFGPAAFVVARESQSVPVLVRLSVTSGAGEGRTPLELEVAAPTGPGPVDVAVAGGPLPLAALGVKEGDMGLEHVDRAEFEVKGRARLDEEGASVSISGHAGLSDLSLREPKLASESVRGLSLTLGGDLTVALDGRRVAITGVEVGLGKVKAMARGTVTRAGGHARADLHVEVPLVACSDLLRSSPPALVPLLAGLEASGTFALAGDVSLDTRRPAEALVDFTVANGCRVGKVPDPLSPERFRRPWTRTVLGADRSPVMVESGPGTRGWVPLFDVADYMTTAVVVCEDARFFTHDGFDAQSIQASIRDDLRAGKFVRGGSTVSMQLAKNLYLGREKTLSRKLQEAWLTLLLEQTLGKNGILELYLNVVELGPGVYGIGPAAWHYFRTTPKELSLAQALYLATLLPNPRADHLAADGTLNPSWVVYLRRLMGIAHKIHRITDAELEAGLAETLRFGADARGEPGEAGSEGERPPEGSANTDVLDMAPGDDPAVQGP